MKKETRPAVRPLLTTEDVAEFLGIDPRTVRKMTRRGEIPAYKVGTQWRYRHDELLAFLEERRQSCATL